MSTWGVAEAEAHLSEVLETARSEGPQQVTRNGKVVGYVISAEEWEKKTQRYESAAEFFRASPLRGSGLPLKSVKLRPRDIEL